MTEKEKKTVGRIIVKKSEVPAPCTYKLERSMDATRESTVRLTKFSVLEKKSFVDYYKKDKSFLPGVGIYKEVESAYKKLSPPPKSMRKCRF